MRRCASYGAFCGRREPPPEGMRVIWEYEHEKLMERDAKIRVMLNLYDGR